MKAPDLPELGQAAKGMVKDLTSKIVFSVFHPYFTFR